MIMRHLVGTFDDAIRAANRRALSTGIRQDVKMAHMPHYLDDIAMPGVHVWAIQDVAAPPHRMARLRAMLQHIPPTNIIHQTRRTP